VSRRLDPCARERRPRRGHQARALSLLHCYRCPFGATVEAVWLHHRRLAGAVIPLDPEAMIPLDPEATIPLDPEAMIPLDPEAMIPLDPARLWTGGRTELEG
jgi:hypothetical protein